MKKKLTMALLVTTLILSACGNDSRQGSQPLPSASTNTTNTPSSEESSYALPAEEIEKPFESEEVNNISRTIDGITISANSFSIEPYSDNSGTYTKRVVMSFTIKNDTDSAFGYITSWSGKLKDGYVLESWIDLMSMDLKQVASGGEKTDTACFLIDDSIEPDEIIVSYNFMDYGQEYWEDFGKIMTGEMGQDEYMKKWGNYEVIEFNITKE